MSTFYAWYTSVKSFFSRSFVKKRVTLTNKIINDNNGKNHPKIESPKRILKY